MDALAVVAVFSLCWFAIGVVTGYAGHRLPLTAIDHDTWLTRLRSFEDEGRAYDRLLRIRRWKDLLPEAGAAFRGGVSKSQLPGRGRQDLERFAAETRRAEYVHWANAAAGPLFWIFQPLWVAGIMTAFGMAVHLPFVAIQRYNRARIMRTLARRQGPSGAGGLASPNAGGNQLPT